MVMTSKMTAVSYVYLIIYIIYKFDYCLTLNCAPSSFNFKLFQVQRCHYVVSDANQCDNNCKMLASSITSVMSNTTAGQLLISIKNVPETCCFTKYKILLYVNDNMQQEQECNKMMDIRLHSAKELQMDRCHITDVSCLTSTPACDIQSVVFSYVYTGCYQIKVRPYTKDNSYKLIETEPQFIHSRYTKQRLVDLADTVLSTQYRDRVHESQVTLSFDPLLATSSPSTLLKLVANVESSEEDSCYKTGKEQSCCALHVDNEPVFECRSENNQTSPRCLFLGNNTVQCIFTDMMPGNYCYLVSYQDERCLSDTIWTSGGLVNKCHLHKGNEISESKQIYVEPEVTSSGETYIAIALGFFFIISVVSAFMYLKYRSRQRRQALTNRAVDNNYQSSPHFTFQPYFSPQLTLTERPKPEVLLVYSRDSKPFMELVACLRRVLENICRCKVYDYFDSDLWNTISEDPQRWVSTLILQRQAKVIIIASEVGAIRHSSIVNSHDDRVTFKTPHPFDGLFLYSLKLLRDNAVDDCYKNHFVVVFDGLTGNNGMLEYFNPYVRFTLPKHLNKLFEHLHDSNTTVHFETNRKLEERFEVRQLRLQLEHLINLKLLTSNNKEQIYDW